MTPHDHVLIVSTGSNLKARCEVMWYSRGQAGITMDLLSEDWIPGFGNYQAEYRTPAHEAQGVVFVNSYRWLAGLFLFAGTFHQVGEWRELRAGHGGQRVKR